MQFRWMALALAIALCLPSADRVQSAEEKELIAVLDLRGVQASEAEAAALTNRLREVLLKSGHFTLVDRTQVNAILDEQALQQTACTEQECAVQVGQLLGVRKIIAGEVVKISAEEWLVSGIMVDVETAQTLRAESVQHQGDYFALLGSGMDALARKLVGQAGPDAAAAPERNSIGPVNLKATLEDARTAYFVEDYATAFRLLRPLAEEGVLEAQLLLARMYLLGRGVLRDYAIAMRWYRKAAEQGDADAQLTLGVMYYNGFPGPVDYPKAVRSYRRAAEQGNTEAQKRLAAMYERAIGVPRGRADYVQAYVWFDLASADEDRDRLAQLMTPPQIAEAQKLAREWKPKAK